MHSRHRLSTQRYLQEVVSDAADGLILSDREVREHWVVAYVGCVAVAVDVDCPFESRQVRMPGTNVLALEVLQLAVDVEAILRDSGSEP